MLFVPVLVANLGPAHADDGTQVNAPFGKSYVLNFDQWPARIAPGSAAGFDIGPNFGAVTSPSGVSLPDALVYLAADDSSSRATYFTPRLGGFQITWSGHQNPSQPSGSISGNKSPSETFTLQLGSVGANFTQELQGVELSIGGDYGTTLSSVPGALGLVEDEAPLRLGAHARFQNFIIGGMLGTDIEGGDGGEALSWDAFGRYDFGALSIGMAYSATIERDDSGTKQQDIPGTLQAGVSYTFTPSMTITSNVVHGDLAGGDGTEEAGIAGVLGFSLDF
jgi:predicted porin